MIMSAPRNGIGRHLAVEPAPRTAGKEPGATPRPLAKKLVRPSKMRVSGPGVPIFVINGNVLVGFDDADYAGPVLEALVEQTSYS